MPISWHVPSDRLHSIHSELCTSLCCRFTSVAFVSKRFHSLTCSPELLACLKLGLKKRPAAVDESDDTHRLHALQLWLLRHAGSLRQLELTVDMSTNTSPLMLLLDGCIAAAGSAGTLQRLTLVDANGHVPTATAYILDSWAQTMSGLRHLSIQASCQLWLPPTLEGLSQLDSLSLEASDLKVTAAQPPRLPRSLTKLCVTQRYPAQKVVTPLQVGTWLSNICMAATGQPGSVACEACSQSTWLSAFVTGGRFHRWGPVSPIMASPAPSRPTVTPSLTLAADWRPDQPRHVRAPGL